MLNYADFDMKWNEQKASVCKWSIEAGVRENKLQKSIY